MRSLGWEDPLEKGKATHFSILAWRISWNVCIVFIQCVCILSHFSCVPLLVTLWTVARQAPLSMGFSRQEYWSGLPCPPPGALPDPGITPCTVTPFTTGASLEAHSFNTLQIFLEHLLCARCYTGHYWTQQATKPLSPWNAFSSGSMYVVLLKL